MTEQKREKIIEEFERFMQEYDRDIGFTSYESEVLNGVHELLKAQEPVEPDIEGNVEYDGHGSWWHVCGACRQPIDMGDKFCRWCGRAVKWE